MEAPATWGRAALLVAAAAALVALGDLHALTNADAIVPVLVSLQRWTPFYWDQERYGMLVPLLAAPVTHPLWNLLLQRFLTGAAALGAVMLLDRHVLARPEWRAEGALAAALLVLLAPPVWSFEYLWSQPYGLSLGVALLGLAFAEPAPGSFHPARGLPRAVRLAIGLALVLVAHWVNGAAGLLLLPLAAVRAAVDLSEGEPRGDVRSRFAVDGALLLAGLVASEAWSTRYSALLPASGWPAGWAALAREAWSMAWRWGLSLAALAAVGIWARRREGPHLVAGLRRAGALVAAALAYALLAGTLRWVAANGFHWRYVIPSALLLHLAALSLLPPWRRAWLLTPLAALLAFGVPSLARVRADLDRTCGALTPAVRAARCDAIGGDYWTVWPAVWHAEWDRRERGEPGHLYGLAFRAAPTVPLWARAGARVCVPRGQEAAAESGFQAFGLAAAPTGKGGGDLAVFTLR